MRKILFFVILLLISVSLSSCLKIRAPPRGIGGDGITNLSHSEDDSPPKDDQSSDSKNYNYCEPPYVFIEQTCCLDRNTNEVCDFAEEDNDISEKDKPPISTIEKKEDSKSAKILGNPFYQKLDVPYKLKIDDVTYLQKGENWGKITKINMSIINQGGSIIEPYLIIYVRNQPSDVFLKVGEFDLDFVLPNNYYVKHSINPIITVYDREDRNLIQVLLFDKRSGDAKSPLAVAESSYNFTVPEEFFQPTALDIQKINLKRERESGDLFIKSVSIHFLNGESKDIIPHLKVYKYDGVTKEERFFFGEYLPQIQTGKTFPFVHIFDENGEKIENFVTHLIFRVYKSELDPETQNYYKLLISEKNYSLKPN